MSSEEGEEQPPDLLDDLEAELAQVEQTGESRAIARGVGKWSGKDDEGNTVPRTGWTFVDEDDLREPAATCEMCEYMQIRYVLTMQHDDYPTMLGCGRVCAGHMSGDPAEAAARYRSAVAKRRRAKAQAKRDERIRQELAAIEARAEARRAALPAAVVDGFLARLHAKLEPDWKLSKNGNLYFIDGDWRCTIFKHKKRPGYGFLTAFGDDDTETRFSESQYATIEAAQQRGAQTLLDRKAASL